MADAYDDIVIGAGHNGLAAAAYLARAGRRVLVLERLDHVGGAAVSSQVFPGVDARLSRYAYLVSLLPQRIIDDLELDVRLARRRIASYTPHPDDPARGLLIDATAPDATAESIDRLAGPGSSVAWATFHRRIGRLAARVWPTVLSPLRHPDEISALVGDDELWVALTRRPIGELLRATFPDDTLAGIVATDALIGTDASIDDASLAQNACYLYHVMGGGTGDWDVPVGGMGAVTAALARAALRHGARIVTSAEAVAADPAGEVTWRQAGAIHRAHCRTILAGCADRTLDALLATAGAPPAVGAAHSGGSQLKVNMLLRRLPRLQDPAVDPRDAFAGTLHVNESLTGLEAAHRCATEGRIPQLPPCEVYCHTLTDRSILGAGLAASGAQTLTVFGLHMPARLFTGDNDARRDEALAAVIRSLESVLAEPLDPILVRDGDGAPCIECRTPLDLERDLGLPGGNIFHRPLRWPWAEAPDEVGTWGVETAHPGVLVCGASARRGGGVSAIAGHNAARAVLAS